MGINAPRTSQSKIGLFTLVMDRGSKAFHPLLQRRIRSTHSPSQKKKSVGGNKERGKAISEKL